MAEQDRSESIAKWRRVFGEDFASGVVIEEAKSVSKIAVAMLKRTVSEAALFTGDLVDAIRRFGARAIPAGFNKKSYMHAPTWPRAQQMLWVQVRAELYQSKFGTLIRDVGPLDPLPAARWLHFRATTSTGLPFDSDNYRVEWRVTNTDEAAWREDCLRGEFNKPENDNTRWESLKYAGPSRRGVRHPQERRSASRSKRAVPGDD